MSRKLTLKQQAFVQAYLASGNGTQAYRVAYDAKDMTDASCEKEARELLKHPRITPYLDRIEAKAEAKALLTLEEHMSELQALRDLARQNGQMSAAIKAEELRGKLRRFYVEQVETGRAGAFAQATDEELESYIAEGLKEFSPAATNRGSKAKH